MPCQTVRIAPIGPCRSSVTGEHVVSASSLAPHDEQAKLTEPVQLAASLKRIEPGQIPKAAVVDEAGAPGNDQRLALASGQLDAQ